MQLKGLGEKIKSYCRTAIQKTSQMNCSDEGKAVTLKEKIENISKHYQNDHSCVHQEGSLLPLLSTKTKQQQQQQKKKKKNETFFVLRTKKGTKNLPALGRSFSPII